MKASEALAEIEASKDKETAFRHVLLSGIDRIEDRLESVDTKIDSHTGRIEALEKWRGELQSAQAGIVKEHAAARKLRIGWIITFIAAIVEGVSSWGPHIFRLFH